MSWSTAASREYERSLRAYSRISAAASLLIHAAIIGLPLAVGGPELRIPIRPESAVTFVNIRSVDSRPVPEPSPSIEPPPRRDTPVDRAVAPGTPPPAAAELGNEAEASEPTVPTGAPDSGEDFVPQFKISEAPIIPAKEMLSRIEYPALAAKQGIEATVYLELYIDRRGEILRVRVLKDPGFGFAQAAAKALVGLVCTPARMNGEAVATLYRYPLRFTLR